MYHVEGCCALRIRGSESCIREAGESPGEENKGNARGVQSRGERLREQDTIQKSVNRQK